MEKNTMYKGIYKHIYPIIDVMLDSGFQELKEENVNISCKKGCSHCCYLLVEVTWEEAEQLALWVKKQPPDKREKLIKKISKNAKDARKLFDEYESCEKFMQPYDGEKEIPDVIFDEYFFAAKRPCPFLENKSCSAYSHRPTACRFHVVTSPANFCSRDCTDDVDTETPELIENMKDEIGAVQVSVEKDQRWGQMAIMVEAVLAGKKRP